jgi:hypothetical protein
MRREPLEEGRDGLAEGHYSSYSSAKQMHALFLGRAKMKRLTNQAEGGQLNKRIPDQTAFTASVRRRGHEAPAAIACEGWRYHHLGIPTLTPHAGERHLPGLKVYVSGFDSSPYGIEWMRFEPDAPYPRVLMTVPHIAFEVDDLKAALEGKEILVAPSSPSAGVRVAMILDDGAPVELLEFAPDVGAKTGAGNSV